MIYGYKEIQFFRSYCIYRKQIFKDKFFSSSSHQEAVLSSIPRTVANRVRRNCADDSEFVRAKLEYTNYLFR